MKKIVTLINFNIYQNIAGIDPNELLSENPDAQYAQLQTLKDLIRDVEEDEVFQQIYANSRPEVSKIFLIGCDHFN